MPAFEMTPAEQAEYGNKLNIWQQIALLQSWLPVLTFAQRFVSVGDPYAKSLVVYEAAEWLAARTDATLDDELVKHLSAMLKTPEGEVFVRWIVQKVEGLKG